jgi:hypothetical protein
MWLQGGRQPGGFAADLISRVRSPKAAGRARARSECSHYFDVSRHMLLHKKKESGLYASH